MKKHLILAAMATAAIFTACSNEDDNLETTGNKVTFVIGGVESRTTTTFSANGTTTAFADNDAIGIFSTGLGDTEMENVEYTYTTANGLTSSATYNFPANGSEVTFKAYYPHTSTITDRTISSSVSTAQSELTNFNASDFLYVNTTGSSTTSTNGVVLTFNHMMALVEVELGSEFASSLEDGETVYSVGVNAQNNFTFNLDADASVIAAGNLTQVSMLYDATTTKYYAIIPPQTITGDGTTALFTITTSEGRAFSYKPSVGSTETFTQGQTTKIKLNVTGGTSNLTVFKVASVTINNWDKDRPDEIIQNEYNVTEEEIEPLNITATLPAVGTITSLTNGRSDLTEAGWGAFGLVSAEVVEDATNGSYIDIKGTSTADAWPNNSLYYYAGSSKLMDLTKTYTISFYAKGTNDTNSLALYVSDKNEQKFYQIVDGTTTTGTIKTFSCTNEYKLYSYTVNPALIASGAYGQTPNITNTQYKEICIAFRPHAADVQVQIKEVTFVEN